MVFQRSATIAGDALGFLGCPGEAGDADFQLVEQQIELHPVVGIGIATGDFVEPVLRDRLLGLEPGVDCRSQLVVDAGDRAVDRRQVRARNV